MIEQFSVLHILGNRQRIGGIIPVVEATISAQKLDLIQHKVLFHLSYNEIDFAHPGGIVRAPGILDDGPSHLKLFFGALRALSTVQREVSSQPRTILQSHTRGGMLVAMAMHRLHGSPVIFSHHAYGRNRDRYRWGIDRPQIRHVYLTEHMREYYAVKEHSHANVISECVADDFGISIAKPHKPASDSLIHLLGLGTLTERKRWHLIPEALGLLSSAVRNRLHVDIFGESTQPDYRTQLLTAAEACGVTENFRVHDRTNNVPSLLATADCFIFPSVLEPWSVALIEALASGVPALAARSGGTTEIVQEPRGGWLFTPDDPADLSSKLEQIVSEPNFLPPPESVRAVVARRRASRTAQQYHDLYRSLTQVPTA